MNDTIARLSAELAALYNDQPHLHRIHPAILANIEAKGGTFDFETGQVQFPPLRIPIVGTIDSETGTITRHP